MTDEEQNYWFNRAIGAVLQHEGGYVNDPADPGGESKYGISKRAYPELSIWSITLKLAAEIYRSDYWDKVGLGALPLTHAAVAAKMLDVVANLGRSGGVKLLQAACNLLLPAGSQVGVDGLLGPATVAAVQTFDPDVVLAAVCGEQYAHYRALILGGKQHFAAGWIRRAMWVPS